MTQEYIFWVQSYLDRCAETAALSTYGQIQQGEKPTVGDPVIKNVILTWNQSRRAGGAGEGTKNVFSGPFLWRFITLNLQSRGSKTAPSEGGGVRLMTDPQYISFS